jgi:hypothetical protein
MIALKGMRLHTRRKNSAGGAKATCRSIAHIGKGGVAERTFAVGFEVAKDIAKNLDAILTQEIPEFPVTSGRLMPGPEQWLADHSEIEAGRGVMSGLGVVPEGLLTYQFGTEKARAFGHCDVATVIDHIPDWRTALSFSDRFHPGRLSASLPEVTEKVDKEVSDMALPSFETHEEAEVNLTGVAEASSNGASAAVLTKTELLFPTSEASIWICHYPQKGNPRVPSSAAVLRTCRATLKSRTTISDHDAESLGASGATGSLAEEVIK